MINVVLVEPEIPQNTGNVARTCACTGAKLHLVRPFGFEISDRTLKRAGLDYWDKVDISYYDSFDELYAKYSDKEFYFLTKFASRTYTDAEFPDECFLVFGKETKGLSKEITSAHQDELLRIPMREGIRCLNLSNSVALVLYEAMRRHDFFGLK